MVLYDYFSLQENEKEGAECKYFVCHNPLSKTDLTSFPKGL